MASPMILRVTPRSIATSASICPRQFKPYYPMLLEGAPGPAGAQAPQQVAVPQAQAPQQTASPSAAATQRTPDLKARIIAEPPAGTRAVIDQKVLPVAVGGGDVNYLCGSCGVLLIQGMTAGRFNDLVIKCPRCNVFNEM